MAKNMTAKHPQSNSQFDVPQSTIRISCRHPRRTAVIDLMTRSIWAEVSPFGRPMIECEALSVAETTLNSGRS
jgi:hypothetical protein